MNTGIPISPMGINGDPANKMQVRNDTLYCFRLNHPKYIRDFTPRGIRNEMPIEYTTEEFMAVLYR
jgi:hypothetical protein